MIDQIHFVSYSPNTKLLRQSKQKLPGLFDNLLTQSEKSPLEQDQTVF